MCPAVLELLLCSAEQAQASDEVEPGNQGVLSVEQAALLLKRPSFGYFSSCLLWHLPHLKCLLCFNFVDHLRMLL